MKSVPEFLSRISIFIAVCIAMFSISPWFFWGIEWLKIVFIGCFFIVRYLLFSRNCKRKNIISIVCCVILCGYIYEYHAENIGDMFSLIATRIAPLIIVILFQNAEKQLFVKSVTLVFALILFVSLFFFAMWFCGLELPCVRIEKEGYPPFTNYYAFIIQGDLGAFTRFQSIFTEPGHIGMISALLLYVNRYSFRNWQNWILLISLIWSFSLAAYLLLLIGRLLYLFVSNKKKMQAFLKMVCILLFFIVSSAAIYTLTADSLVSELIIGRLAYDEKKGIEGNNRNDASFERYYNKYLISCDYFTGIGTEKYALFFSGGANSSYKVFIMQYGIIGISLLFVFFFSFVYCYPSSYMIGLFILYCASFIQRPYALWEIQSFLFICATRLSLSTNYTSFTTKKNIVYGDSK